MKRHRQNAADTINKALLARRLAGRKRRSASRDPLKDPDALEYQTAPAADKGQQPPAGRQNPAAKPGAARHYGLHSPFFRLRTYLYKMRGCEVHDSCPGPGDFLWSCFGSFIGIFILVRLDASLFGDQLLLLGSFGASSIIIFGAPHSSFAQPRSVIGGQVLSAFSGAVVYGLLGAYPLLAAPLSVTLAFAVMQITKTMHPPGGATALIAGSGQPIALEMGILYPFMPVGTGVALLFLIGVLVNNLSRNRQYPLKWF